MFGLIWGNNLFTDVQDQVLPLVGFDQELMEKRRAAKAAAAGIGGGGGVSGGGADGVESEAIQLLVDNIHLMPIPRVAQQLQERLHYLFLYFDAPVHKDSQLVSEFANIQIKMYTEFATHRLIDFLRSSGSYNLQMAYKEYQDGDLAPEMVLLLGQMGGNKKVLSLIIEGLGDVHRVIDFAKEQSDDDFWEDLLWYSETRPAMARTTWHLQTSRRPPAHLVLGRAASRDSEVLCKPTGLPSAMLQHYFKVKESLWGGNRSVRFRFRFRVAVWGTPPNPTYA